jgi:phytol kinase
VQLTVAVAWLALVVLLAEIADRVFGAEPEIVRKVVHIGAGNIILLAWWLQIPAWVGISASILFSAIALLSHRVPIMPTVNSIGRKSLGTFFYANSFGILIWLFWQSQPYYAALGILVMTWGDGLAALVGQRWGRHTYELWGMKKSWEGSLAMAAVSYGVSSLILIGVQGAIWQTWVVALAVAIAATILEAFSKYGIDNLTVPLGSAMLAFLLNQSLTSL